MGLSFLRKVYRWFLKHSFWLKGRGIPVDIGGCGEFKIDPLLAFGNYEDWGTAHNTGLKKWIESCRDKFAVFDIGAHIGLYSLPASRVIHAKGFVYAFEPAEKNCVFFQRHISYNKIKNIRVFPYIVGEFYYEKVPFFERIDEAEGMNALLPHKNPHLYTKTFKKQVSLDEFCLQKNVVPEVIKIDVEGAECKVLKGAREVMKKYRPLIFLSVHPGRIEALGDSLQVLLATIIEAGYGVYDMEGNQVNEFFLQEYILHPLTSEGVK